ncbi:P-ATPase, partial [Spraguea lophii 42_110]
NTTTNTNTTTENNKKMVNINNVSIDDFLVELTLSEDLKQGDILILKNREEFPCDSVFLNSKIFSHNKYQCRNFAFIETSNLDGEINLKKKMSNIIYKNVCKGNILNCNDNSDYFLCTCDLEICCDLISFDINPGGEELYDTDLVMKTKDQKLREKRPNILLRGSTVQNVHNILALITVVGKDTKLSKNIHKTDLKKSTFETKIEHKLFYFFVFYFLVMIVTSVIVSVNLSYKHYVSKIDTNYFVLLNRVREYVNLNENVFRTVVNFYYAIVYYNEYFPTIALRLIGTNYILYSYLIPLSLFVMIELSKIFQSKYINYDKNMMVKEEEVNGNGENTIESNDDIKYLTAKCRNSAILEDLGRVDYIVTDKTGTLTKNEMYFKLFDVGFGLTGVEKINDGVFSDANIFEEIFRDKTVLFSIALLCCNSLLVVDGNYEGVSQEEVSMVGRLRDHGMVLVDRSDTEILLMLNLNLFKGDCINEDKSDVYANGTKKVLDLRVKIISTLDFSSDRKRMSIIVLIENRYFLFTKGSDQALFIVDNYNFSKTIDENSNFRCLLVAYRELEKEDLAQNNNENKQISLNALTDENVLEQYFTDLEKGLNFLGITFIEDKIDDNVKETITSLKENDIKIWMITGDKRETAVCCAQSIGLQPELIISGIEFMEQHNNNPNIPNCNGVIYRAIPDYKAKFTKYLKNHGVVLAIGDGGNDVSMINVSNIGIGIMGKEGSQAALSSDLSILKFHHLQRLLFHHGKNDYIRTSKLVVNSFYKNLYLIAFQFFYNFNNNFTGKSVFNYFFLNYFNILFTSFIPLFVALFDKSPEKYTSLRKYFSNKTLLFNMVYAVFKASILYYISYFSTLNNEFGSFGHITGYTGINNYYSTLVFYTIFLTQLRSIHFITSYTIFSIIITLLLFNGTLFGIQDIDSNGDIFELYATPTFYILIISILLLSFIIDRIVKKIVHKYDIIMH